MSFCVHITSAYILIKSLEGFEMKIKRIISIILSIILFLGTFLNSYVVNAKSYNSNSISVIMNKTNNYEIQLDRNFIRYDKEENLTSKSITTYFVKKAVKWAIHHMDELANRVSKHIGKRLANKLIQNSNRVIKTFYKLLEYEDLAFVTVQDQVRNTLTPVVGYSAASTIALGVRIVLEAL